ncbi:MAG: ABC transporter substrate-binding protein, partial [Eggerthellaceae bacterium]|nr:ABC transporter substrate-binding protein [Eggerthellaceae bacterium]
MKKTVIAALAACVLAFLLAGCATNATSSSAGVSSSSASSSGSASASTSASSTGTESGVDVRVASLKGPTSIGIAQFIDEATAGKTANKYDFAISGTADEVLPKLIQGNVDIALIPANAAATVYAKTNGAISVIDVNTLGVLYAVSGDSSLGNIADLAGKTVYMTGKGTTPEYVMSYLLSQAGITDKVTLEFKSEASEVAAVLAADANAIGVLPEPYVTSVSMKNDALAPRISLTEAWDTLQKGASGSQLVTGVTVVRNEFAKAHPSVVAEFIEAQRKSVDYALADPTAAGELVVKANIMDNAKAAATAIPRCNLVCLTGEDMKKALSGYLDVLLKQDPASVGGALPGDDFY